MDKVFRVPFNEWISFEDILKINNLSKGKYDLLRDLKDFDNRLKCKFRHEDELCEVNLATLQIFKVGSNINNDSIRSYDDELLFIPSTIDISKFYNIEKEN